MNDKKIKIELKELKNNLWLFEVHTWNCCWSLRKTYKGSMKCDHRPSKQEVLDKVNFGKK